LTCWSWSLRSPQSPVAWRVRRAQGFYLASWFACFGRPSSGGAVFRASSTPKRVTPCRSFLLQRSMAWGLLLGSVRLESPTRGVGGGEREILERGNQTHRSNFSSLYVSIWYKWTSCETLESSVERYPSYSWARLQARRASLVMSSRVRVPLFFSMADNKSFSTHTWSNVCEFRTLVSDTS
jgi:hypothetical protein